MREQEYLYTIYKEGSFSKAAKRLYVSQPALSLAVKKVEADLGITIFDRNIQPLQLTDEGRIYIRAIEEMRATEKAMKEQLSDISGLRTGHVTVSGENFVSSFILPDILMEFARCYNGVQVELVESNSPDLRNLLLSENIDLLVAHDIDATLYEPIELFEEEVLLAVPEANPINRSLSAYALRAEDIRQNRYTEKPAINLNAFDKEAFLVLKPGNDMHARATQLCSEAGFQPQVRIALDQLITSYNLAAAGMGLTFVTDILVKKSSVAGCLYYRIDSELAHRTMCIIYKKNRYLSHATTAFIETARRVYDKKL